MGNLVIEKSSFSAILQLLPLNQTIANVTVTDRSAIVWRGFIAIETKEDNKQQKIYAVLLIILLGTSREVEKLGSNAND